MNLKTIEWNCFCIDDLKDAYREIGHEVVSFPFFPESFRFDPAYEASLTQEIHKHIPDYVFSFNYYPVISKVCSAEGIPYVCWVYDSPYITLYSYTTISPCNHIFIFDKDLAYEFIKNGIQTVHYLPLAANTKRLDGMNNFDAFSKSSHMNKTDISFVGALYTESYKSGFFHHFDNLSPFAKGYLDGVMAAQKNVYGYNFVQETMTPEIMEDMMAVCPSMTNDDGVESNEYIYSQYYVNRKITSIERTELLHAIADRYPIDIYTPDQNFKHPNAILHDPMDPYEVAPYVYKNSKINLNMSLRSIKSGIPLRAFDIMGAGGFLLSNYQTDFFDLFIPGDDFAFYDSQKDLLDKLHYYLQNEQERIQMAASAHDKIAREHSFVHRIKEMESYL